MAFEKILIVDDELIIRKSLQMLLQKRRYQAATAGSIEKASQYLATESFDLVFLDLRLPDGSGMDLLTSVMKGSTPPYIVMMTGYGSVESAVNCLRAGAFDYIIKPFSNSQIEILLKKAEEHSHIHSVARYYSQSEIEDSEILGESAPITNIRTLLKKVAPTNATVLILGESGTGKELIASEIHRQSTRSGAPFIRVNCAAISETLMESEFFGHEKGAFTGATHRHEGRFELAHEGTILLDEISEISTALQAKLLRVLQEHEFERVGGNKTIKIDVRVIATTNRDLAQMVKNGGFREDLFYRLNVVPIINPSLRDRREDIPLLVEHFLKRFARKHGVKIAGVSAEAMNGLMEHDWSGNVRELQNTVERAVILSEESDTIEPAALGLIGPLEVTGGRLIKQTKHPFQIQGSTGGNSDGDQNGEAIVLSLEEMEKQHILLVLKLTGGNRTKAADLLKVSLRTLRNKIRQYRMDGETIP